MYNIVIFGTGSTSILVESVLNSNVNIVCYCDNNKSKWDTMYQNRKVINPNKITDFKFDYVVIASQFNEPIYNQLLNLGVNNQKIFQFFNFIDSFNYVNWSLWQVRHNFDCEIISTGISYIFKAIKPEFWEKNKLVNIANASQDLYFDYHMIRYLIKNYKAKLTNFRYVLIGLCYYSFEYNLSLAAMKEKSLLYYEAIGEKHNYKILGNVLNIRDIDTKISKKILKLKETGYPEIQWEKIDNVNYDLNYEIGQKQALLDGNKNYPETVKENTLIFKEYLKLLKDNNIKPIVITCPVSKYYSKYFPKRITDEFHRIVNEVRKEYEFQFLDYFNSDLFNDEDFYDISHFNDRGAKKFAQLLQKKIEW